jgi:hypothetical protein
MNYINFGDLFLPRISCHLVSKYWYLNIGILCPSVNNFLEQSRPGGCDSCSDKVVFLTFDDAIFAQIKSYFSPFEDAIVAQIKSYFSPFMDTKYSLPYSKVTSFGLYSESDKDESS